MFKISNRIDGIIWYKVNQGNIVYTNNHLEGMGLYLNYDLITKEEVKSIVYDGENIIYTTTRNCVFVFNIIKKNIRLLFENSGLGEITFSKNRIDLIKWKDINYSSYDRFFYDYKKNEVIFKNSVIPTHEVNSGQLFERATHTLLKSINLESGTYLWETDLSDYCKILSVSNEPAQGMIRQVFGVWGDKLWVGFDGNQYASLDLLTGKVLQYFKLEDIDEIFQEVNALSPYFDGNNGLLCFLENRIYAEINLNTLRVERKKNFVTDNTETDWNFSSNTFSESHVYFVATRTSSRFSPNYVGVFDRATMEVVWSKDLELYKLPPVKNMPARFLAQAPQSDGDKLYVLDTHGTLHVFEKIEENEFPSVK